MHNQLAQMMRTPATGNPYGDDFVITFSPESTPFTLIFPFTDSGVYSGSIDFGDGDGPVTISSWNDPNGTHEYTGAADAEYAIRISGTMGGFEGLDNAASTTAFKQLINLGTVFQTFANSFIHNYDLTIDPNATGELRGSAYAMFLGCTNLNGFPPGIVFTAALTEAREFFHVANLNGGPIALSIEDGASFGMRDFFRDVDGVYVLEDLDLTGASNLRNFMYRGSIAEFNCTMPAYGVSIYAYAWASSDLIDFGPGLLENIRTGDDLTFAWSTCSLNEVSVNNILISLDSSGATGLVTTIRGASPTGAGVTALDNLVNNKACTINLINP